MERRESRFGAAGEGVRFEHLFERRPQRKFVLQRVLLDLLDRGAADAARGRVDDAQQADRIVRADQHLQIRQNVLHFGALVEAEAADHDVLAAVAAQRFFDLARLRVGAIEHRDALLRIARQAALDGVGDPQRFVFGVGRFVERDLFARAGVGPQRLADALGVVGDHGAGGFENGLRRAVVLLQANDGGAGEIALEIEDVADVGAAPAVDRLILVAHHADVVALLGEQAHQIVLAAVGVLILVDHHEFVALVQALAGGVVVAQQVDGFEQQIVEIQRVRFAQARFVAFVDGGEASGGGVGGGAGDLLGRLLVALGVADARERRARLHELVVEAERLVDRLDDRNLVVVVVDGEERREAAAELAERSAFAPQQPHAEGVEGGDGGRALRDRSAPASARGRAFRRRPCW